MIYLGLVLVVVALVCIVVLYHIGKRVKEKEKELEAMMKMQDFRASMISKYKNQSTPKVPSRKK
jgi:hypothetical protein